MSSASDEQRRKRLAQALRANLRQRKRDLPAEGSAMRKREDALAPRAPAGAPKDDAAGDGGSKPGGS